MEFWFVRNWIPLMVIFYDKIFISFYVESILAISSLLHIPLSPRSSVPFPWRSKSLVGWVMCYIFSLVVQILTLSKFQVHFIVIQVISGGLPTYVVTKFFFWGGGGSSDENEKVLGKFLARLRHAKKRVPKFFACGWLFFCRGDTENRSKTVNFSNFFTKTVKFLKKGTPKIFRLRRAFFSKVLGRFYESPRSK